jgi:hypothetical protein
MGGAGHKMAHNVFVWDRDSGVLVKVLEGPKESLIHCDVGPSYSDRGRLMDSGTLLNRLLRLWLPQDLFTSGNEHTQIIGQRSLLDSKSWKRMWSTTKERTNSILQASVLPTLGRSADPNRKTKMN